MKTIAEMNEVELAAHIQIFCKPEGAVRKPQHNMPLWWDINTYFKQAFNEFTDTDRLFFYHDELISDMQAYFKIDYTEAQQADIYKMLFIEYKVVENGKFRFLKDDFFKPITV